MKTKWPILILLLLLAGCAKATAQPVAENVHTAAPDTATPTFRETQQITIGVSATDVPVPMQASSPLPSAEPIPTPSPVLKPQVSESPAPTPAPTAAPLSFTASPDMPLPAMGSQVQRGNYFWIDGIISSGEPITLVRAEVISSKGSVAMASEKQFSPDEGVRSYRLLDETFSREIDCVAEELRFHKLPLGSYTLRIIGRDISCGETLLAETSFQVTNESWLRLQPNNLRLNYSTALAFFGSPERFMFRYRMDPSSHKITIESSWIKQYIGSATCLNGKKWVCHIDAVPYFEQACRYMEDTYVRVTGNGFDTGPVRLSDLVNKMDGTMIKRFTNSGEFISHHSFGTAVDINASFPSNKDNLTNRERIYAEVQKLTYNGIETVKGKACYDFTYTGTARGGVRSVPEPLVNYLLYELAFFRAGFSWGVYYPHKSDAMHFTLTELSPNLFCEGPYAMRKVFSYIEDTHNDAAGSD